jgi:hypothetical protein
MGLSGSELAAVLPGVGGFDGVGLMG